MRDNRRSVLRHVAYTYTLMLGGFSAFGMVYGTCDIVASLHSHRVPLYFEFERELPFVPVMTLAYCSLYAMFLFVPFILRTQREVHAMFCTYAAEVGIAGLCFLALPVEPTFPPDPETGVFGPLFDAADGLNMTYNLFPSIHVAFAASAAVILGNRGGRGILLGVWAALVCASTVLVHQHHLADVAGGLVLAFVCIRVVHARAIAVQ